MNTSFAGRLRHPFRRGPGKPMGRTAKVLLTIVALLAVFLLVFQWDWLRGPLPVSYTHLTLPTIYSV